MIHLTNITKRYGPRVLYEKGSFQINPKDRIGLVGPNGAGKTTVFRLITREEHPEEGNVNIADKAIIGYFSQDVGDMSGTTVLNEVMTNSGKVSECAKELEILEKELQNIDLDPDQMEKLVNRFGDVQHEFEKLDGYNLEGRVKEILGGLGFTPHDHHRMVDEFSGGWKMRIALAKILALNPDFLLLDEPTNYLDVESIVWLEEWLTSFKGAIIMTCHDREFMNRLVKKIVAVEDGTITVYGGDYDFYERERKIRREQLESAHARQQEMLAKEEEFIAKFKARASHAAQVQSRVKKLEKIERIELPIELKDVKFEFQAPPRSGNDVVKFQSLGKTFELATGEKKNVFSNASALVTRLQRVAVVGVNGAGKSTLLKIIAGDVKESTGVMQIGANVQVGYFSQLSLDVLDPNKTVMEEIEARIPNATIGYIRSLLGAFLFSRDDVFKKVSVLSGGEKSRLLLATILSNPVNFLIFDEPTNHLDIKTREVLLNALKGFDGTLMIVSHDRYFLKHLVDRVFELDKGELRIYEGDYEYYLNKRKEFQN